MSDRCKEVKILLERLFGKYNLVLIRIGHLVNDSYALRFNESGYDQNYNRYDPDVLLDSLSKELNDEMLLRIVNEQFKEFVYSWARFCGKHYKYDPQEKILRIEGCWSEIKERVERYILAHGSDAYAIIGAILQVCIREGKKYDNWWLIFYEAKRRGVRNWITALTGLERTGLIERHKGDIWVPEELIPLLEDVARTRNINCEKKS